MAKFAAKDSNKNITLSPHGTGKVVVGTGSTDATVQSDGNHNLVLQTGNATTGSITITDGADGNIDITPNGTGEVNISKVDIDAGNISGTDIDVSSNTLTTSSAQKTAIVDGGKGNLTKSDVGLSNVTNDAQVPASGGTFSGNVAYTGNIQVDDIVEKTSAHGVEIEQVTLKAGKVTATTLRSGLGSESAPGIEIGDDNTGLFDAGNDAIGFTTGGSQKMHIDANGKIGVGTDSPNAQLEISNDGTSGNIPTVRLNSTEANVGNGDVLGQIDFKSADSGRSGDPAAAIKAVSSESDGSHTDLTFSTGENADAASERMRIDSSGNLKFNSGFGSVGTAYGCRAWVNFRGTTQSGTATASGLVSGQYTATVTSATQFTVVYSSTTYTINTTGNHDIAGGVVGQSEGVVLTVSGTSVTIDTQIRGSGNVSSVTDNGLGDYTINFTTAMPDTNYAVQGTMGQSSSGANAIIPTIGNSHALSTSSVRVGFFVFESALDPAHGFISIFR